MRRETFERLCGGETAGAGEETIFVFGIWSSGIVILDKLKIKKFCSPSRHFNWHGLDYQGLLRFRFKRRARFFLF